jgi:hypothetical protein
MGEETAIEVIINQKPGFFKPGFAVIDVRISEEK